MSYFLDFFLALESHESSHMFMLNTVMILHALESHGNPHMFLVSTFVIFPCPKKKGKFGEVYYNLSLSFESH